MSFLTSPQFADLPPAVLAALQSISRVYTLQAGEILFYTNDRAQAFYIVESGSLRLVDIKGSQDVALRVFGVGDVCGLMAITGEGAYPAQVEAITASRVWGIWGSEFRRLMFEFPELGVKMTDLLIHRLHTAHDRVRQMAIERVEQRLAKIVLTLVNQFGVPNADGKTIDLPLSRQDLADLAGTTLETVSRVMREWEKKGVVRSLRLQVTLLDETHLTQIALSG